MLMPAGAGRQAVAAAMDRDEENVGPERRGIDLEEIALRFNCRHRKKKGVSCEKPGARSARTARRDGLLRRKGNMKKPLFLLLILSATLSCSGNHPNDRVKQRIGRVENGLVEFASPKDIFQVGPAKNEDLKTLAGRMKHYHTPGVSIAVIENFALDWARAYGVLKTGQEKPVDADSRFEAASTTKLMTAAVVLHYAGLGILNLDEDINVRLKSWKLPENDFTRLKKVSLRLLLTHQAGLPATNFPQKDKAGAPTLIQILNGESPALNKPAAAEYVPGAKWQYSNIGYVVIQQILEDAIGKPFSQIARETVFEPLGMRNSTVLYPLEPRLQADEAWPHDAEGILREPQMIARAQAHGGLMTTPSDLALLAIELMRAYHGRSDRLLSKEMARRMFTKAVDLDPAFFGGQAISEGLGVMQAGEGDHFVFLHPGSNLPGSNCWLLGYPETGKGIVVMTNGAQGEILAMEIIAAVNREYGYQ
jgi:CubicO group peptidase (beta-lactamase class C family)